MLADIAASISPNASPHPEAARHLCPRVVAVTALAGADRQRMFEIYAAHYDGTSWQRFCADLASKDLVLTVHDPAGIIQGFTTIRLMETTIDGVPAQAIYSGDTIIDRAHWGSQTLAFTWLRLAGAIKAAMPERPLYWFLIVKGHRTFRYLSAFSRVFYPHWTYATPAPAQQLMDHLAQETFPGFYQSTRGIIHFPQSHGHLTPDLAEISPSEAQRADVAFFLARNPGYRRGDELVCLTELCADNLRPLARKQFLDGYTV